MRHLVHAHPQTQIVLGEAPLVAELVDVAEHEHDLVARRARDRQVVLPERSASEMSEHRPRGHPEHHGTERLHDAAEHLGHRIVGVVEFGVGGAGAATERLGQRLEQLAVRGECLLDPLEPRHRYDGHASAGGRSGQPGGVGDLEVGHPGELFELDAVERIDVRFGCAFGGDRRGELSGCIPADRALLLQHPGQIAEQRQVPEGVVARVEWTVIAHVGMVGR
jgi:hypothetical protein